MVDIQTFRRYLQVSFVMLFVLVVLMQRDVASQSTHYSPGWTPGFGIGRRHESPPEPEALHDVHDEERPEVRQVGTCSMQPESLRRIMAILLVNMSACSYNCMVP